MKLIKKQDNDIYLVDGSKTLIFTFGGNGDLYWAIRNSESDILEHETFIITKENYALYEQFETLFKDIKNINIFLPKNYDETYEEYMKQIEEKKDLYRVNNFANYHELYDDKNSRVTWYSDNTAHEVANYLIIEKIGETFKIDFHTQPYIKGYDMEDNSFCISVRICNSGSSYRPFNILFMKMFNNMHDITDINDYGHQYHIEEYQYMLKKKKEK